MKRRNFIALLGGAAVASPLAAQQKAMPVIGYLASATPAANIRLLPAFLEGLSEDGWVEGRTFAIEYRWAEDHYDRLPALAADLVARKVDAIVSTGGTVGALSAKDATSTIPIVFITGDDPVEHGLVASLARPRGNLTGFSLFTVELMPKRLELLCEIAPQAKTITLLVNPKNTTTQRIMREVKEAARAKGCSYIF
jgi:ABC-type uncharacterized transport system substrate-binding protein